MIRFVKCHKSIDFINKEKKKTIWKEDRIYRILSEEDGTYYVESEFPDESFGISQSGFEECFSLFECECKLQKECNYCKYLNREGNVVQCFFLEKE